MPILRSLLKELIGTLSRQILPKLMDPKQIVCFVDVHDTATGAQIVSAASLIPEIERVVVVVRPAPASWTSAVEVLEALYSAAAKAAYESGRPFLQCLVLFESISVPVEDLLRDSAGVFVATLDGKSEPARNVSSWPPISLRDDSVGQRQFAAVPLSVPEAIASSGSVLQNPKTVALGGTFDHLHHAHLILLSAAAFLAEQKLICGVYDYSTNAERLARKKYFEMMQSLETRMEAVRTFLGIFRPSLQADVVAITDDYGPTRTLADLQAIVGSQETKAGCAAVNAERQRHGLGALDVYVVGVVASPGEGEGEGKGAAAKISSSHLRIKVLFDLSTASWRPSLALAMDVVRSIFFGSDTIPHSPVHAHSSLPRAADAGAGAGATRRPPEFYFKLVLFGLLYVLVAFFICLLGLPALPLSLFKLNHVWYRRYMRQLEKAFAAANILAAYAFVPGTTLVVSGDWERMDPKAKQIVMANHQAYPDWFYIWIFAWFRRCHGDLRVMLIYVLSMMPLLGQGMQLFEFVFLHQKLEKDKHIIKDNLTTARKDKGVPLWLLIFPEGTLNTPGNVEKSKKYAEKMAYESHPSHCILPKSTGLFLSLKSLSPEVRDLYDITIAYSNVSAANIPFSELLPDKVFLEGKYPRQVHVHVHHYSVAETPGFRPDETGSEDALRARFDEWLRGEWKRKDDLLKRFYEQRTLSNESVKHVAVVPRGEDWLYLLGVMFFGYGILPLYWSVVWFAVQSVWKIVGIVLAIAVRFVGVSRLTVWAGFMAYFGQTVGLDDVALLG
ncbi:hypothetical protein HDU82_002233 [Entophlyctis luteolus]|nr:hypothetical protein HDU82_002233 [Entophlyctis luteolus]